VAYDVSGALEGKTYEALVRAARAFSAADAGVVDGRRAIDYALGSLAVDPRRVVVAGHSSAATIALALAENDSRVKACLAYAPIIDVPARLGSDLAGLEAEVPGLTERLVRFSPLGRPGGLKAPTFLFHAQDDDNAPRAPIAAFAKGRANVEFAEVPEGGHYDSMMREGVPGGLAFLRARRLGP
jgi:dipeptidyl aminopeptidase/acylaminoacyl peptidase